MKPLQTTIEEVLREAIESEVASRIYYLKLSERAKDEAARSKLVELAERQVTHRLKLERRYRELVGEPPPKFADPPVEIPAELRNIDLARGLRIALEHERESESNFRFLAERTTDPDLLRLFLEMAEMEWKHKAEIQAEFDEIGGDPESLLFE